MVPAALRRCANSSRRSFSPLVNPFHFAPRQIRCVVTLAGIALLSCIRLVAQDVTVTPPAWINENNITGDQPPTLKHHASLRYPDELRKSDELGYVLIEQSVDTKGKGLILFRRGSHVYFQRVVEENSADELSMRPAQKKGKPVDSLSWFAVIFNPASAKTKGPDAGPRLLAVAPVRVPRKIIGPANGDNFAMVWATVKLNEKGEPGGVVLEDPASERFLPAINESLTQWRFAPARRAGTPVSADLRVAFFVRPTFKPNVAAMGSPPRTKTRAQPKYPLALRASRLRGEVLVEFVVTEEGRVTDATIARTNNPAFNEPALEAIRKWTFEPAIRNGKPVKAKMQQPITFDLVGTNADDAYTVSGGRKGNSKLPPELRYDTPPKVRGVIVPVYPYDLRRDGIKGKAAAGMMINEAGQVVRIEIVEATKPEFGQALTAALETFSFDPALKDGKPIPSFLRFEQEFNATEFRDPESERLLSAEKKHPEKIATAKELDGALKPISRQRPVFPLLQREKNGKGQAMVDLIVDDEGYVRLPRIVSASAPAFGYAAVQAVSQWRFESPKAKGKAVAVRVRAPFEFSEEPAKNSKVSASGGNSSTTAK